MGKTVNIDYNLNNLRAKIRNNRTEKHLFPIERSHLSKDINELLY